MYDTPDITIALFLYMYNELRDAYGNKAYLVSTKRAPAWLYSVNVSYFLGNDFYSNEIL